MIASPTDAEVAAVLAAVARLRRPSVDPDGRDARGMDDRAYEQWRRNRLAAVRVLAAH